MAFITCPDCGNQYDETGPYCPNCGRPNHVRQAAAAADAAPGDPPEEGTGAGDDAGASATAGSGSASAGGTGAVDSGYGAGSAASAAGGASPGGGYEAQSGGSSGFGGQGAAGGASGAPPETPYGDASGGGSTGQGGGYGSGGGWSEPSGYGAPPPPPQIPNYLVQSILVTLMTCVTCCIPIGAVALYFSLQVNSRLQAGDVPGAMQASKNAKLWCWIAFGIGVAVFAINMAFGMLAAILAAVGNSMPQ
jgi:hypothetical protein